MKIEELIKSSFPEITIADTRGVISKNNECAKIEKISLTEYLLEDVAELAIQYLESNDNVTFLAFLSAVSTAKRYLDDREFDSDGNLIPVIYEENGIADYDWN